MSYYTDTICPDPRFRSTERIADLALLEPITRMAVAAIVAEAALLQTPLMVFETYRSCERQTALFVSKATQLPVVGVHHFGLAADLVRLVDGHPSWKVPYDFLGPLARKYGLLWGGTFTGFRDMDHVQRCQVHDQNALFDKSYYPPDYLYAIGPLA